MFLPSLRSTHFCFSSLAQSAGEAHRLNSKCVGSPGQPPGVEYFPALIGVEVLLQVTPVLGETLGLFSVPAEASTAGGHVAVGAVGRRQHTGLAPDAHRVRLGISVQPCAMAVFPVISAVVAIVGLSLPL